jgi:hypothetical protein
LIRLVYVNCESYTTKVNMIFQPNTTIDTDKEEPYRNVILSFNTTVSPLAW